MAPMVPCIHLDMPPRKPDRHPEMALIKDCKQFAILAQIFDRHDMIAPMVAWFQERGGYTLRRKQLCWGNVICLLREHKPYSNPFNRTK